MSLGSRIEQMLGGDNGGNKTVPTEGEESENGVEGDGSNDSEEPCVENHDFYLQIFYF